MFLLDLYRPEPAVPLLTDPEAIRRQRLHWRIRMFLGFFLGYAILYFCRKNISNAMPEMARDLGYTNTALGVIGTTLYITYGLGKFLNGVMADRSNIRRFMATGLILSGLLNVLFSSTTAIWLMALVWGLNGWFQSMGFPPIARGMTLWFPSKGKSTLWALWTCSHQLGTALVMAFTAWILTWGTWRTCFWLPGVLCIVWGVVQLFLVGDTPQSRGLEPEKAFDADTPTSTLAPGEYRALFIRHVLLNRNVWAIGLVDLCVYVVRFGTLDWASKYLHEAKGYEVAQAGLTAGIMPTAGIVGVLLSGVIADVVFKARYRLVNAVALVGLAGCMYGLLTTDTRALDLVFLAGIGFFVEGPQSILGGVGAVDAGGSVRVASAAAGLVGILAYFGASLSGVGTGWCIDSYGWAGAFWFWIGCALLGFALCVGVWKERAHTAGP